MVSSLLLALVLVTTSVLSVLAALMIAQFLPLRRAGNPGSSGQEAAFLIDNEGVIDANTRGTALLRTLRAVEGEGSGIPGVRGPQAELDRLMAYLLPSFPDLADRLRTDRGFEWELVAPDSPGLRLRGTAGPGDALRLSLSEVVTDDPAGTGQDALLVDRLSWRAMTDEMELMRRSIDLTPTPAWRETQDGQIVWANGAYLRLLHEVELGSRLVWPLPALFARNGGPLPGRVSLMLGPRGRLAWFDLVETRDRDTRLVFALPADDAHKAERARRDFVQTLTKTFATLPIGLAVFDRTRRLHLFNPALAELTRLEPEFLASRPGLEGFLNRMRDKHILPEPRDYRAWSRRLLDVETAGTGNGFEETWPLSDGRSFRVSAAPHPDGALAFLIEDITADIHLKRSFRAELDTGQTALDMVETALAMFSAAGDLVLTNVAFDRLWTLEGADTLSGVSFRDAVANWRDAGDAPALWDRIGRLPYPDATESRVEGAMTLPEGETFRVTAQRAPNGGVMLSFSLLADAGPKSSEPPRLRRASA